MLAWQVKWGRFSSCTSKKKAESKAAMKQGAWLRVCLEQLQSNVELLSQLHGKGQLCCVIKANAYGCGMHTVAHFLSGLGQDVFAVARLDEALSLRASGLRGRLLTLSAAETDRWQLYAKHGIEACLVSLAHLRSLVRFLEGGGGKRSKRPLAVQLKIDTGMHRLGILEEPEGELLELLSHPGLELCGIFSHLAGADMYQHAGTEQQRTAFVKWVDSFLRCWQGTIPELHLANSAGLLRGEAFHFDRARVGYAMWSPLDFSPSKDTSAANHHLQQPCTLQAAVSHVKRMSVDGAVGYGGEYQAQQGETLAVVGIGYADGYARAFSQGGWMLLGGQRYPVSGRVSMDQTSISLGQQDNCDLGDIVTVYGGSEPNAISLNEAANWAKTIGYELLTRIGPRVQRIYTLHDHFYKAHPFDVQLANINTGV